jgi:hypothetical protein
MVCSEGKRGRAHPGVVGDEGEALEMIAGDEEEGMPWSRRSRCVRTRADLGDEAP